MKVTVKKKYLDTFLPPRCRKYRQEIREIDVTANIREVKAEDAPVAFVVLEYGDFPAIIRLYKNRLYRDNFWFNREYKNPKDYSSDFKHRTVSIDEVKWEMWLSANYSISMPSNVDEATAEVRKEAKDFIIVDGILYRHTYEPYYVVNTYGLGNNHGGTGLSVGYLYKNAKHKELPSAIYPATQRDEAVHAALTIALGRGDDKSVDYLRQGGSGYIYVLIPDACKFKFPNHDLYKYCTEENKRKLIEEVDTFGEPLPYQNYIADVLHSGDMEETIKRIKEATGIVLPTIKED